MTSEIYFPEQRHQIFRASIRRERMLPDYAAGEVEVNRGARVSINDVVARGVAPSPYVILNLRDLFGNASAERLREVLEVRVGSTIVEGEVLAQRGRRKVVAPVTGSVVYIGEGRVVLQEMAQEIELEAGLNGVVIRAERGRGVILETYGAVLQGVWGNGRRALGALQLEPSDGIENIYGNALENQYRGALVITRQPLRAVTLNVIEDQGFSGVIAPGFEPDILPLVLQSYAAILITEGFGSQRMSTGVFQFLDEVEGRQALLDAITPDPLTARRPELIINVPLQPGERPPEPNFDARLDIGMPVRLTRGAQAGVGGVVVSLPRSPVLLDNGLRVDCAQVELITGERVMIPLANIEVVGS